MADAELLDVMADVGTQIGRVIERERAQRTTLHLALHDPLTDLPNRHLLDDRLDQAIAHARRHDGRVALLFIDLDDFKSINDTFGHPAGDVVLHVEDEPIRERLVAMGYKLGQGYGLARPMPGDALAAWLRARPAA